MGFLSIIRKIKRKEKEMRILVVCRGLDNSGKTTIMLKINGEYTSEISPTLGFNIKTITYNNLDILSCVSYSLLSYVLQHSSSCGTAQQEAQQRPKFLASSQAITNSYFSYMQLQALRRGDVLPSTYDKVMKIGIRECKEDRSFGGFGRMHTFHTHSPEGDMAFVSIHILP